VDRTAQKDTTACAPSGCCGLKIDTSSDLFITISTTGLIGDYHISRRRAVVQLWIALHSFMLSERVAALETNKTDDEEGHASCRRHVQQTVGLAEVVELGKRRGVLQKSIPER
jgi:hypothetical protein